MVEIITEKNNTTRIFIDGKDVTKDAVKVEFCHQAGEIPVVTISYLADECVTRTLGEVVVKRRKP